MLLPLFLLSLLPWAWTLPSDRQFPLSSDCQRPVYNSATDDEVADQGTALIPRIAIIGSGIVGASAAFTLAENARQNSRSQPVSITILEQNPIQGGRITITQVFDQPELTIDTCAATFQPLLDRCIANLAASVGLTPSPVVALDNGTAVWNGQEIVGLVEDNGFRDLNIASNFKKARFDIRYGKSPFDNQRTVIESSYSFLGNVRFESLSRSVSSINTTLLRGACEGEGGLCNKQPESELYLREVIDAGVRDRFFGDYDELNELNSVLGLSSQSALQSVQGGNLRLVDRLIKLSGARLNLNTKVQNLQLTAAGKWNVFSSQDGKRGVIETFDRVIIAAPISLADLTIRPDPVSLPRLEFANTVVTHFTTRRGINPTFFRTGLPVPQNILTSATATRSGNKAALPFFSLRLLDNDIRPVNGSLTEPSQRLYKIVSSTSISNAEILQYLEPDNKDNADSPAITWINREFLPRSVPRLDRTLKLQDDIEVLPGLYYAGGGAQVTDTIEFGCRMGRNAARLIVPDPTRKNPGNG